MPTLAYIGRAPDNDATVVPKSYADSQEAALAVTTGIVNSIITTAAVNLTSASYVDSQDALRAHKTDVTTADNSYLASTARGAASGVASLDPDGNLTAAQVPTAGLVNDRVFKCYSLNQSTLPVLGGTGSAIGGAIGNQLLASGATRTVTTTSVREFRLATIVVPDPGFPWRPLPFAWIQGNSSGSAQPASRQSGTGNYGLVTCCPPSGVSDAIYGIAVCTASYFTDTYELTPYAAANQTHTSVPPITGGLQLDLYCSCWSGTSFTFLGTNLQFFVLAVPSL